MQGVVGFRVAQASARNARHVGPATSLPGLWFFFFVRLRVGDLDVYHYCRYRKVVVCA